MAQPRERHVAIGEQESDSEEERFRVGGSNRRGGNRRPIRPTPSTLEVQISDSDWETGSQCEMEAVTGVTNVPIQVVFGGKLEIRMRSPGYSSVEEGGNESSTISARVSWRSSAV